MKRTIDQVINVEGLDAEFQNKLLDLACYLITQADDDHIFDHLQPIPVGCDMSVGDRAKIFATIKQGHMLDSHPVAAMLVSEIDGDWRQKNRHEILKRHTLIAAARFPEPKDKVRVACRRVRLITKKNGLWLFEKILATGEDLSSAVLCLRTIDETLKKKKPLTKNVEERIRRCADLRVLLADYLDDRDRPPKGPRGPIDSGESEDIVVVPLEDYLSEQDWDASIVQGIERDRRGGASLTPEQNQRYLDYRTVSASSVRSCKAKLRRDARHAISEIRMRASNPPCGWSSLTDNEAKAALKACFERIDAEPSIEHACIVLSLILGRKPTELLALPSRSRRQKTDDLAYWFVTKHRTQLTVQMRMPDLASGTTAKALTRPGRTSFSLSIPTSLIPAVRELVKLSPEYRGPGSQVAERVRDAITTINVQHHTRLNEHRLAAYVHSSLAAAGVDEVLIRRIRGTDLKNNVPQHYDACMQSLTLDTYGRHVTATLDLVDRESDWSPELSSDAPLGSSLNIPSQYVRAYFRRWRKRIDQDLRDVDDPVEFHNEYALATHAVLSVCSGYRAVRRMFETILDFDPISRELFISDKRSRLDSDSRCIVLPEIGCEQMALYQSHLRVLQRSAWGRNSAAARAAKRALSGDGPLLFRIHRRPNDIDEIQYFDKGKVEKWLEGRWDLVLNWTRHFLCTRCRNLGYPFEAINAMLGHPDLGPSSFNRFSQLSYQDMARLASQVNSLLASLDIRAIAGRQ
jgi:hypothetical protein